MSNKISQAEMVQLMSALDCFTWVTSNGLELSHGPWELEDHEYQVGWLQEKSPRQCFIKGAQIVKLADRIHNLRTLEYGGMQFQKRTLNKTIDTFLPAFKTRVGKETIGRLTRQIIVTAGDLGFGDVTEEVNRRAYYKKAGEKIDNGKRAVFDLYNPESSYQKMIEEVLCMNDFRNMAVILRKAAGR